MNASDLMDDVTQLPESLRQLMTGLEHECKLASQQWTELKKLRAARADHAASLLHHITVVLHHIEHQAAALREQAMELKAMPFGPNG